MTDIPISPTTPVTNGNIVTSANPLPVTIVSGGATPSGPAGGDLTGTYPNPTIKTSVSLTTPILGVAAGTSLALGGATIGANALAVTGTTLLGGALTSTLGTITADAQFLSGTATWNNSAVQFRGLLTNVVNTASGASSYLFDFQTNSSSVFKLAPSGALTAVNTLTSTAGTITASTPMIAGTQTWNNSAVVFKGITLDVINTASDATSDFMNFTSNSTTTFRVTRAGSLTAAGNIQGQLTTALPAGGSAGAGLKLYSSGPVFTTGSGAPTAAFPIGSLYLRSDGSNVSTRLYSATSSSGAWTNITTAA